MRWWEFDNRKSLYPDKDEDNRARDGFAIGYLLSGPAVVVVAFVLFLLWLVAK